METLKAEAEALRVGLLVGLVDRDRIVAWADSAILADRAPEAPVVLDLALAGHKPVAEIVSLLSQVPGEVDQSVVGRRLAGQLRERFARGTLDVVGVARAMYRLLREGYAPDDEFESMAYVADDRVDLALEGVYGTLDDVSAEVAEFLERYADADGSSATPAP